MWRFCAGVQGVSPPKTAACGPGSDADGSGSLDLDELTAALSQYGSATRDDIWPILQQYDTNGNGVLEFDEFQMALAYLREEPSQTDGRIVRGARSCIVSFPASVGSHYWNNMIQEDTVSYACVWTGKADSTVDEWFGQWQRNCKEANDRGQEFLVYYNEHRVPVFGDGQSLELRWLDKDGEFQDRDGPAYSYTELGFDVFHSGEEQARVQLQRDEDKIKAARCATNSTRDWCQGENLRCEKCLTIYCAYHLPENHALFGGGHACPGGGGRKSAAVRSGVGQGEIGGRVAAEEEKLRAARELEQASCATNFPHNCSGSNHRCGPCGTVYCGYHVAVNHGWFGGGHQCPCSR